MSEQTETAQADLSTRVKEAVERLQEHARAEEEQWQIHRSALHDVADLLLQVERARLEAEKKLAEPVKAYVSPIHEGEEGDGPLKSTDLYLRARGISLLVNVDAGREFTYSLNVDGKHINAEAVENGAEIAEASLTQVKTEKGK